MADTENRHLQAIARALSVQPQSLFDGTLESEAGEAATLLRLWFQISDVQGRNRVLSVARQEAESASHYE